ncbi:MAG TPA: hypothetical protein VLL27_08325 [Solirubrobacterales bacterium]|nr:hypothetical protein [Solirubrobacterales bacterium]
MSGSVPGAAAFDAANPPRVTLAWLPSGTSVEELAQAGFSPGLMSAGLGTVPAEQTYLDVGQGNRVFDSLYDEDLPRLGRHCFPWFEEVVERAASAPAEIVPALLAHALRGVAVLAVGRSSCAFELESGYGKGPASIGIFGIGDASLAQVEGRLRALRSEDLLIAIARPTGRDDDPLAIGVAGAGFDGNLTSDSTRTDGYVLSTDLAPTILDHFGIDVPSEMSGEAIRSEGSVDPAAIEALGARMEVIGHRRGPVIGWSLLVWLGLLALTAAASRGRLARPAVRLTGLAVIYMPLTMLLGAALEPGENAEVLLVLLGAPLLGALTLAALKGYRALAAAAAITVLAYAADVIAGSPLTSLSLLGPNPGLGVRFYGIGNELEALLAVLIVAGTGAGLAGFVPSWPRRRCGIAFLVTGLLFAFVFAAGRFGADVGAAIVFPVGAAVAAAVIAARSRRGVLLVIVAPFAVLALLALIDLVSGANAHLTRSVLDAGGLGDLADVAQRRLQLSAHSFARPVLLALLPLVIAFVALAIWQRDRLGTWLAPVPAMRAGLIGAVAATAIGTLANDSGALLLEIGTAYLLVFTSFAWAESASRSSRGR